MRRRIIAINIVAGATLLVVALALGVGPARGQAVAADEVTMLESRTLTAVADAGLYEADPNTPYGCSVDTMTMQYRPGAGAVGLVRFDLSSLPSDPIIDSATMRLYLGQVDPHLNTLATVRIGAYFVTSNWNECEVRWNSTLTTETFGVGVWVDTALGYKSRNMTSWAQWWQSHPGDNRGVMLSGPLRATATTATSGHGRSLRTSQSW